MDRSIIETIVKDVHSKGVNTRKKLNLKTIKAQMYEPLLTEWFVQRNLGKITVQDFIDTIFKEAASKQRLDYKSQTISFDENDAQMLGVTYDTSIHIFDFFSMIPELLKIS